MECFMSEETRNYDNWGLEEWKYENIRHYFYNKTVEKNTDKYKYKNILNVEHDDEVHSIEKIILDAYKEIRVPLLDNLDGDIQVGVGIASTTTKQGQRQSTFNAFLKPKVGSKNLKVLTHSEIDEIIFENTTATGIVFHIKNNAEKKYVAKTAKEIIISAGTINSVKVLLKSGIRPKDEIDIKYNQTAKTFLPVGQNLQDHIYAPVIFKMKSYDNSNTLSNIFESYYQFITEKKGPLGNLAPQRVISFINTNDAKSEVPNIQNHFIVVYPNQSNFVDIFHQHRLSEQFYKSFNELNKDNLLIIVYVTLLQPESVGSVSLNKNNQVVINANYLHDNRDLEILVAGMKNAIKLENTEAFKTAGLKLHWIEIDSCKLIDKTTDHFLKCIAKHLTGTLYHAVGTNKMGKIDDDSSVIDEKLKVKNVKNLRVIDASVMPKITRGNTMAPVIMIADKGSELIKENWS